MTGPTDIVSNGQITYLLRNGDPIQTRVTGVSPFRYSFLLRVPFDSNHSLVLRLAAFSHRSLLLPLCVQLVMGKLRL